MTRYIDFDVAMPAFHGGAGEDGAFVGLLEFLNIPYTGPRAMASKITSFCVQTLPKLPNNRPTRKSQFLYK